jgi:hypothetical protein
MEQIPVVIMHIKKNEAYSKTCITSDLGASETESKKWD